MKRTNVWTRATLCLILAASLLPAAAQAAEVTEDDGGIPLSLDAAPASELAPASEAASAEPSTAVAPLKMGLWVEASLDTAFLTRDIATGTRSGFELDRMSLDSKANWWFWGPLASGMILDAEIALWKGSHSLYQANSYAGNVPLVTPVDGLQNIADLPFAPLDGLNKGEAPALSKLALNLQGDFFGARVGFGTLGKKGMSTFTGIFGALTAWDDAGPGYLEVLAGTSPETKGQAFFRSFAGLSKTRARYGAYGLLEGGLKDQVQVALSLASTSDSTELFRYDESNRNALGIWVLWAPVPSLSLELHGIGAAGTDLRASQDSLALGARIKGELGPWRFLLSQTMAGPAAATVWGDDASLGADSLRTRLHQHLGLGQDLVLSLYTDAAWSDLDQLATGALNLRNQGLLDKSWQKELGIDFSTAVYATLTMDRFTAAVDPSASLNWRYAEAGLELKAAGLSGGLDSLRLDYAHSMEYQNLATLAQYHSLMVEAGLGSSVTTSLAGLVRVQSGTPTPAWVPWGIAAGARVDTDLAALGKPRVWGNFVWGMDPWQNDGFTLQRHDAEANGLPWPSYRLDKLYDATGLSHLRFGLAWNL